MQKRYVPKRENKTTVNSGSKEMSSSRAAAKETTFFL
jgi:hypothetical protein